MKVYLIAAAIFTTLTPGIESADNNKKMTYQEFKATISMLSKNIADSPDASVLLTKREFRSLFDHAEENRTMTVQLLHENVSNQDKAIGIYAIQNLNLDNYLLFLNELLALAREKKVSSDLLERALIPGFEWNTKLQENWQSPKVREVIERIRESRLLPARCDQYLNDIISGQGAEHVKRMRRDGELPANAAGRHD